MINIDLFADIIPGQSAAGFELGIGIHCLGDVVTKAKRWTRNDGQLGLSIMNEPGWLFVAINELGGAEASDGKGGRYHFGSGAVELKFDSEGSLEWIAVGNGYMGKLMGAVGIGDKLQKVADIFDLTYDDVEELHFPANDSDAPGIMFQAEEAPLNSHPDQSITRIIIDDQRHRNPLFNS